MDTKNVKFPACVSRRKAYNAYQVSSGLDLDYTVVVARASNELARSHPFRRNECGQGPHDYTVRVAKAYLMNRAFWFISFEVEVSENNSFQTQFGI